MIKEACVETLEEAISAEKLGADRVELCTDLENNGLTPSPDLMQKTCAEIQIPVMVMIRPRAGNFCYSEQEIQQMQRDIDEAKNAGAAGVVFGLLTPEKKIDEKNTRLLAEYAHPLPITFHKAIDESKYPVDEIKVLKKIHGIKRILTSGGKPTAYEGVKMVKKMIAITKGIQIILVAGKVTNQNLEEIEQLTGAKEFHGRNIVGKLE